MGLESVKNLLSLWRGRRIGILTMINSDKNNVLNDLSGVLKALDAVIDADIAPSELEVRTGVVKCAAVLLGYVQTLEQDKSRNMFMMGRQMIRAMKAFIMEYE